MREKRKTNGGEVGESNAATFDLVFSDSTETTQNI